MLTEGHLVANIFFFLEGVYINIGATAQQLNVSVPFSTL
jgi:hypothetical protein